MNIIKKILLFSSFLLASCQTLFRDPPPTTFTLDANTIQFIGTMPVLMSEPLKELQAIPEGGTAYLYIFSTGGDPRLSKQIIEAMKGKTTYCYIDVAGGGAFTVMQACTYRLVGGMSAVGTGKITVRSPDEKALKEVSEYEDFAADIEAPRLGMSTSEYKEKLEAGKIQFLNGTAITENSAADGLATFKCADGTDEATITRTVITGAGKLDLVMTQCPRDRKLVSPDDAPATLVGRMIGVPLSPSDSEKNNTAPL